MRFWLWHLNHVAGSEAALQAQLQTAESRHEGLSQSLVVFLASCPTESSARLMTGRDLADADAQTTPEGEAEQTATILVKAGITTDYKGKKTSSRQGWELMFVFECF